MLHSRYCCLLVLETLLFVFSGSFVFSEETTDLVEIVKTAKLIAAKHKANNGKIMFWRGTVEEIDDTVHVFTQTDEVLHEKKLTSFLCDAVKRNFFTKSTMLESVVTSSTGKRTLRTKQSECAFFKDGVYHYFPTYELPPDDPSPPAYRRIAIGQEFDRPAMDYVMFVPQTRALPGPQSGLSVPESYERFFDGFSVKPNPEPTAKLEMSRIGDVVTIIN